MQTQFVVLTASAKMPSSCKFGIYRRVAVLEVEVGYRPCRIDARPHGVVRIVRTWERCNVGSTDRCAYGRAVAAAHALAAELTAARELAAA